MQIFESFGKRNENKTKNAQGVVLMAGASRIWKYVKSNLLRVYDVDLLGLFYDFSQQVSSFVRPTAVCSATFGRDLFLQLLNPYHIISAVNALQAAAQLEVARLIVCVLRDEHLSIDRSVCPFFRLGCCWLRLLHTAAVCYASSRHIITYNAYWLEEVVGPVAQRFGEWVSASRTFSAIIDLIAVVQREVGRLFVFIF